MAPGPLHPLPAGRLPTDTPLQHGANVTRAVPSPTITHHHQPVRQWGCVCNFFAPLVPAFEPSILLPTRTRISSPYGPLARFSRHQLLATARGSQLPHPSPTL
ncbi:hypothetical protein Vretimale_4826 [Volvox reticuliferus]|uniref:Uncharacterized protein n=1 Tax=Volvox reticuliferus TaxID=1737510 RepID=A0A8J4G529_9CHLO|nr:hypothetical protein Vretimale_4826 [Volvox reticuliferus]